MRGGRGLAACLPGGGGGRAGGHVSPACPAARADLAPGSGQRACSMRMHVLRQRLSAQGQSADTPRAPALPPSPWPHPVAADKYDYERLQMALHDTYVRRLMAYGMAGLRWACSAGSGPGLGQGPRRRRPGLARSGSWAPSSWPGQLPYDVSKQAPLFPRPHPVPRSVVADSLSAIKHAKVFPVYDDKGIMVDFRWAGRQGESREGAAPPGTERGSPGHAVRRASLCPCAPLSVLPRCAGRRASGPPLATTTTAWTRSRATWWLVRAGVSAACCRPLVWPGRAACPLGAAWRSPQRGLLSRASVYVGS